MRAISMFNVPREARSAVASGFVGILASAVLAAGLVCAGTTATRAQKTRPALP